MHANYSITDYVHTETEYIDYIIFVVFCCM